MKYFREALEVSKKLRDEYEYVGILGNTAYVLLLLDSLDQAYDLYDEAVASSTTNGFDCLLPFATEGMALVLEKQKKYNASRYYFQRANAMATSCQLAQNQITTWQGLGRVYRSTQEYDKAVDSFSKALVIANDNQFTNRAKDMTFELYQTYKAMGRFQIALEFHESYKSINDALYSEANIREVTKLEEQYKFDLERANLSAERELEEFLLQDKLKHQVLYKNFTIAGIVILIIVLASLYMGYLDKQKSNARLTELNKEKNQLIGVVAHDLRSPLNNIKGLLGLVRSESESLSDDQKQYLELIADSVERQRKMISRVLDVNAIESQSINLRMKKHDLGEIIGMVANNFYDNARKKGIQLLDHAEKQKHFAEVDKNYLIQVLENIISNAIKFSPKESEITIKTVDLSNMICVCVEDHGPGISSEEQKELFKPYKKLSAQPTDGEESSGLGLSIVKKYVDAMNGKIKIDSELGQGTKFMIEFKAA